MKKCYYSRKHVIGRVLCIMTSPLLAVLFTSIGVFLLLPSASGGEPQSRIPLGIGILLFCLAFSVYETLYIIWLGGEYELCELGIKMRYAGKKERLVPWNSVTQICVCEAHRGADKRDYLIWCTVGNSKFTQPNMPWYSDNFEFEFIHCRSVIAVEFSEERLKAFKRYYEKEIPDYRSVG